MIQKHSPPYYSVFAPCEKEIKKLDIFQQITNKFSYVTSAPNHASFSNRTPEEPHVRAPGSK
jgi:hypothetical protein